MHRPASNHDSKKKAKDNEKKNRILLNQNLTQIPDLQYERNMYVYIFLQMDQSKHTVLATCKIQHEHLQI